MIFETQKSLIESNEKKINIIQCTKKKDLSAVSSCNKSVHQLHEHAELNEDPVAEMSDTISASTSNACSVNEINLGKYNFLLTLNFCKSYILLNTFISLTCA